MRPLKMVPAGLLLAAALPGCGGSDDKQTTTATVGDDQRGILATLEHTFAPSPS